MTHKFDLIIWDNDGTLADTEVPVNLAFLDTVYKYIPAYKKFTLDYITKNCIGGSVYDIFESMARDSPNSLPPEESAIKKIIEEYQDSAPQYFLKYIKHEPKKIKLLHEFSESFKMCVVSNGRTRNVVNSIIAIGAKEFFPISCIFTPENTGKSQKPAPDLIYHAAKVMGINDMNRILLIEDTVRGAQSGLAAGVTVVGCTWYSHEQEKSKKDLEACGVSRVFQNIEDLANFTKD
jgi:beta-phosphoglucomutase-like phosphatase (HAD superfamily)